MELTGEKGVRRLPIGDFYLSAGKVDLRPDEIQTAILIPKISYENCFGHYIKYAMRSAMDIATTGCSVNVVLSGDKRSILRARIAYGVAGPIPMRAPPPRPPPRAGPSPRRRRTPSPGRCWRTSTPETAGGPARPSGSISPWRWPGGASSNHGSWREV